MKKITLLIILIIACYCFSSAQTTTVKGVILDNMNQMNLIDASVSLLRQKDSILYKFTRSDVNGVFEFKNLLPGNYLLFIRQPFYEDHIDQLQLKENSKINMGSVKMILKPINLKQVTVHPQINIVRIIGDTIEFNPAGFKVRQNASVEEMLKKLPGIQVAKDGSIIAMGREVNKVLVDGEDFFGDDPAIATKNLQADAVYKIQVYDKKSDQATFSGIDDGLRSKTINLVLKNNMKKTDFGKLDFGYGLNDKWNNSVMLNSFRDKIKISAYGSMSSTDINGLDLQQGNQVTSDYVSEFNNNFVGSNPSANNDNELNNVLSYGEGLPKSITGGINYSGKFNQDQQSINGSYRYNQLNNKGYDNTFSQSTLPDTIFVNSESSKSYSNSHRHALNGTYEWQINASTSIKIRVNTYKTTSNGDVSFNSESRNKFMNLVNNSMRNIIAQGDDKSIQSYFLIRKRFNKPGRTISFSIGQNYNQNKTDGFLHSLNSFFDKNGSISFRDTTDQKKGNVSLITSLNGKVIYTEPLSNFFFIEFNYSFYRSNSNAQRASFDKDLTGKYALLNDTLSNHYNFNVFTNLTGVAFRYNSKKVTFSFGSNIAKSSFEQKNLTQDALLKRDFINLYPKAIFAIKFNENSHLSIIYNGNTLQPSIKQIQPLPDNSNPLNIIIGNPLLKQEFDHNINFNFNSYNLSSQQGMLFYGSVSLQSNAIVTNSFTDTLGRAVYKYVNAAGNYNYNSGLNYFINIEKFDMNINAGLNFNKSNYSNIVNNKKNTTNNTSTAINLSIDKDEDMKYDFYYYGTLRYNSSASSIRKDNYTKYWTQEHSLGLTLLLPWKFELNNELQGSIQQKTTQFNNNNILIWNAYFGKRILKNDKAIIKIDAHDILNQNTGYSRYISSNVIQETNYQTIARYFLLSIVWNFSKIPATDRVILKP
ncbi:MAG: outer rane beta-barrel protein [Mucilaginibacter sp.]|nr:outer rane beta-barrel protein [Mucilaginibacter sp.]